MGPHSPDYFLIRGEAQKPCFLHFSSRLGRLLQQSAFRSKTTIDFAKSPFIAKPLKKRRSISLKKSTARQQKFFRGPKSHDASILFGKHIANAKDFSIVFEHRDRSREASARRSISVVKSTARQQISLAECSPLADCYGGTVHRAKNLRLCRVLPGRSRFPGGRDLPHCVMPHSQPRKESSACATSSRLRRSSCESCCRPPLNLAPSPMRFKAVP